ncbi:bifunctional EF-Hand 1 [Babesia duncani]|uniref:Bifunctional EF-Hand 1 n=1 Tax=Babesia duncani TaxID=323732 RepID=A0AAD9PLA4_9APIC|nr:bifunctional EF-Hand 1 [Babesia duncani]
MAIWKLFVFGICGAGKVLGYRLDDVLQGDGEDFALFGLGKEVIEARMDKLFSVIDLNNDGILDLEELAAFHAKTFQTILDLQLNHEMELVDRNKDGFVDVEELKVAFEREGTQDVDISTVEKGLQRRFVAADKDQDGKLNRQELGLLLNPGRDEELINIEIEEIMQTYDQNGDGLVSLEEYSHGRSDQEGVSAEFKPFDSNADGFLSREEIRGVYVEENKNDLDSEHEDLFAITGKKPITREVWNANLNKIAHTSLTDHGEMLRFPEDYHMDLGDIPRDRKDGAEERPSGEL